MVEPSAYAQSFVLSDAATFHMYGVDIYTGILAQLTLITNLKYGQLMEMLYFLCDAISILLIWFVFKGTFNNLSSSIVALSSLIFNLLYPYNKLSDTNFVCLYVLMTLVVSLTIIRFMKMRNIFGLQLKNAIKESILDSSLYVLTITLLYFLFSEDLRMFLYPLSFYSLLLLVIFILAGITRNKKLISINIIILSQIAIIIFTIVPIGFLRTKLFSEVESYIPFVKDAFRPTLSRTSFFPLMSGNSWTSIGIHDISIYSASISLSFLLASFILLYLHIQKINKNKTNLLYAFSIIMIFMIVLSIYIKINSESNFLKLLNLIFSNSNIMYFINTNNFLQFKNVALMFRVPRFFDFCMKVLFTCLIILFAEELYMCRNYRFKQSAKIIIVMVVLLIIVSYTLMLHNIIINGCILQPEINYFIINTDTKIITNNFPIQDWCKLKILFEAFLNEGINTSSLVLQGCIVVDKNSAYFNNLSTFGLDYIDIENYRIILLSNNMVVGKPLLVLQGLADGAIAWSRGYLPIYLDQLMGETTLRLLLEKLKLPILVTNQRNDANLDMALSLILNMHYKNVILIPPAHYCTDFTPSLSIWSPGFIGDPHHGIFYEPKNYEYDYTYDLNYGVAQAGYLCDNSLNIPFKVANSGLYELFIRYMHVGEGKLFITIDGEQNQLTLNTTHTAGEYIGFLWKKVCSYNLEKGLHNLEIKYKGSSGSKLYINLITLIPSEIVKENLFFASSYLNENYINLSMAKSEIAEEIDIKYNINRASGRADIEIRMKNPMQALMINLPIMWGNDVRVQWSGCDEVYLIPVDYVNTGLLLTNCNGTINLKIHWTWTSINPNAKLYFITSVLLINVIIASLINWRTLKRKLYFSKNIFLNDRYWQHIRHNQK
jgi:hypothetical protein